MDQRIIEFNRPKKYLFKRNLDSGACGTTVLLYDTEMDCDFVAKKYSPIVSKSTHPDLFNELIIRFKNEAKILFNLNHKNIVRVFNFYDYKEKGTSYIIMEYIEGRNIKSYIQENPYSINSIFEGVIDGFQHLEENKILHRDIRHTNILIDQFANAKIIDFGFSKTTSERENLEVSKSISLNWWCETPDEFKNNIYNFKSEIYFIGQLFNQIIQETDNEHFLYKEILDSMIRKNPNSRTESFSDVKQQISSEMFENFEFDYNEKYAYQNFANSITGAISKLYSDSEINENVENIKDRLAEIYKKSSLEDNIQNNSELISVFIRGKYKYYPKYWIKTDILKEFIDLIHSIGSQKTSIIIMNLKSRLDGIKARSENETDDVVPF